MKNTYIKPEITIVEYETEVLMLTISGGSLDGTTYEGDTERVTLDGDAQGRRGKWGNLWE